MDHVLLDVILAATATAVYATATATSTSTSIITTAGAVHSLD